MLPAIELQKRQSMLGSWEGGNTPGVHTVWTLRAMLFSSGFWHQCPHCPTPTSLTIMNLSSFPHAPLPKHLPRRRCLSKRSVLTHGACRKLAKNASRQTLMRLPATPQQMQRQPHQQQRPTTTRTLPRGCKAPSTDYRSAPVHPFQTSWLPAVLQHCENLSYMSMCFASTLAVLWNLIVNNNEMARSSLADLGLFAQGQHGFHRIVLHSCLASCIHV